MQGTSPATAQAAWMAAELYAAYPGIWPETVRALMIHSARWTDRMYSTFCKDDTKSGGRRMLLQTCGYGIPDLNRAIQCMDNWRKKNERNAYPRNPVAIRRAR